MRAAFRELLANLARKLPPKRVASKVVTRMWMKVSMMPAGQLALGSILLSMTEDMALPPQPVFFYLTFSSHPPQPVKHIVGTFHV